MKLIGTAILLALFAAGSLAAAPAAQVYIISPGVDRPNTGHHHLLVDVVELPAAGSPIPADNQHIHFGGGQTETTLELAPGKHTLQLIMGNQNHVPHDPPLVSERITITVK